MGVTLVDYKNEAYVNFEKIIFILLLAGFIIIIAYKIFHFKNKHTDKPWYVDYAQSLLPVLVIIFAFRSFVIEPFVIPSSSMAPTLTKGDFILVNKFAYALKLPILKTVLWQIQKPQLGDIVVFHASHEPNTYFIKRIVGLPGDTIGYKNKHIILNGKPISQKLERQLFYREGTQRIAVDLLEENLHGVHHKIYLSPDYAPHSLKTLHIPPKEYFVMGDNRDNSHDSRAWGLLPANDIIGKAFLIWMSWDHHHFHIRWQRLGKRIH